MSPAGRSTRPAEFEILASLAGAALLAVAWARPLWEPFYSRPCVLKLATGIPCAACGGTRSMHAWTHGRFAEAFGWNPLAALLALGITMYVPYAAGVVLTGGRWRMEGSVLRKLSGRNLRIIRAGIFGALILNWLYLIGAGR